MSEELALKDDALVTYGSEVKALGDGRVGGYLVRFSGPKDPDLTGDFFTEETNFGPHKTSLVFYHHGYDGTLKRRVLDDAAPMKKDKVGMWVEAQLNMRDEYEKEIYAMAQAGKLGWSSGTAGHLVEREPMGKAYWIKTWHLGLDASLTPTPAEPRTSAVPIKSIPPTALALPAENDAPSGQNPPVPVSPEAEPSNSTATSDNAKGLLDMDEHELIALLDKRDAAKAAKEQAEAEAKAANQKALADAVAEERKKWEAEQKAMRRGSYLQGKPPAHNKGALGDNWHNAFKSWVKDGDRGALELAEETEGQFKGMESYTLMPTHEEEQAIKAMQIARLPYLKASNATDMNIGTAADGGNLVPTGFYPQIIARRDETMLRDRLGVRMIPGTGTTVDVPVDNEADGEFVSKAEANDFDLDAPAVDKKSMTLVKYTKYTDVSYELLDDTPTALEAFLADFVGRGMAKTHNSLLLTEVASGGTSLKTFAAAAAIAAGEIEGIISNDDLAPYLDEDNAVAFVMRSATLWAIKAILGDPRVYGDGAGNGGRSLLGYPVHYSQKAAAVAASAKPIYFGNWRYVGNREAPGITFLRDPYTVAIKGQVRLLWHFRTVYKTLQGEAIGYAVHPSA